MPIYALFSDELREAGRLQRPVEEEVILRFLECGDPHHGFARVYCDACGGKRCQEKGVIRKKVSGTIIVLSPWAATGA